MCRIISLVSLFFTLWINTSYSQQIDTFKVALVSNNFSLRHNFSSDFIDWDVSGRGTNYIITGYLYPGNYFEEYCPDLKNCGILLDTENGITTVNPEDTAIVIGDWDCRSLILEGVNTGTVNGELTIGEISCQTFNFYAHPESPCPAGCYVVTESYLDNINTSEGRRIRSISGGTDDFTSIRGDLRWKYLPEESTTPGYGINATGYPNLDYNFIYTILSPGTSNSLQLDVSTKNQSLILDGELDSISGMPVRGTTLTLGGVIYAGGTLDLDPNSGLTADGLAEWDSIGTWYMRGSWLSDSQDLEQGLFVASKQYFDFTYPGYGQVQVITDCEAEAIPGETAKHAVLGGTNELLGYSGAALQKIIGQNSSGGWNLRFTFDLNKTIGTRAPAPEAPRFTVFPNPASEHLTVSLDQIRSFGNYSLEITDVLGRRFRQQNFDVQAGSFTWNLEIGHFSDGLYFVVLKKDGQVLGSKGFVKAK